MKTEELQLVTFEQAKRLKELGFNWETTYYYRKWYGEVQLCEDHSSNFNAWIEAVDPKEDLVSAPTVALALKWFRDEKNLFGTVEYTFKGWAWKIKNDYDETVIRSDWDSPNILGGNTYEEAESALLDRLLNILEEEK